MAISAKASVAAQNGSAGSLFFFFVMNYIVKTSSLHTCGEARKVHSISAEIQKPNRRHIKISACKTPSLDYSSPLSKCAMFELCTNVVPQSQLCSGKMWPEGLAIAFSPQNVLPKAQAFSSALRTRKPDDSSWGVHPSFVPRRVILGDTSYALLHWIVAQMLVYILAFVSLNETKVNKKLFGLFL